VNWCEQDIIIAAVKLYKRCGLGSYAIDSRPDQLRKNRNHPEIDAIATAAGKPKLAVEHTRLQSFEGQLLDDSRVEKLCLPLVEEIALLVPNGIHCVMPILAFAKGFAWDEACISIRNYITDNIASIPNGRSLHSISNVPFPITIHRDPDRNTKFCIVRESPSNKKVKDDLLASMQLALNHKKAKLQDYLDIGCRSVLVIESNDIALISHIDVYAAYLVAEASVDSKHVADVLYAMTADPKEIHWLCFKGSTQLLKSINPENFMIGPEYKDYWDQQEDDDI
jgi:hypothetical protein